MSINTIYNIIYSFQVILNKMFYNLNMEFTKNTFLEFVIKTINNNH